MPGTARELGDIVSSLEGVWDEMLDEDELDELYGPFIKPKALKEK